MQLALVLIALVIAVTAAVRSTWSPCGLSMLSTITPLAELGRGHRFRSTATWFVIGAVVGGLTLGLGMAALAGVVATFDLTPTTLLAIGTAALLVTAISDSRLLGRQLPNHPRQVNERWLDQYRSWVYGAGFGWQIGVGLATYIMTAAVYALIVLGALTASPPVALALGVTFGLVRGLAILLGRSITSTAALVAFHRRFDAWREPVRRGTVVVQATAAIAAGLVTWGLSAPTLGVTALAAVCVVATLRTSLQPTATAPAVAAPTSA
ncbi:MAG: hypothetical protein ACXWCM_02065 [Acidimicrobiales bacterium]